jgi:glycerophosphoryl diester phosphodiesterase
MRKPTARERAVLLVAHRGASERAPENTGAAARLAVRLGADAVECDVQLARDGVPVVFHDDDLWRLCGEPARVAELTSAQLVNRRVRVSGRTGRATAILTLAQWLRRLPGRVIPVVELKAQRDEEAETRLADAATSLLARRRGQVAVISFSARMAERAKRALPDALVGPVVDRAPREGTRPVWLDVAAPLVALSAEIASAPLVALLKDAKKQVWCWTVNEPEQMRRLAALGVAGVISDRVDVARATLRGGGSG